MRFNKESMQISGVVDELRVSGFCHEVQHNMLVEKLHEDLPLTMGILMDQANTFIQVRNICTNMGGENTHFSRGNGGSSSLIQRETFGDQRPVWRQSMFLPYPRQMTNQGGKLAGSQPKFTQNTKQTKTPRQI